ncbi:hypothetical protein DFQ27_008398 [Actinomortierella ambigua]|uniref:Uncharacterized protein n=1 Tax=Actinomortierella ambigua TaxID=1343610 RepID=A0A9P6UBM5_9FUNG|nr:hypothetical protein DFQ27_008398 [Actinomortierella ambigua]
MGGVSSALQQGWKEGNQPSKRGMMKQKQPKSAAAAAGTVLPAPVLPPARTSVASSVQAASTKDAEQLKEKEGASLGGGIDGGGDVDVDGESEGSDDGVGDNAGDNAGEDTGEDAGEDIGENAGADAGAREDNKENSKAATEVPFISSTLMVVSSMVPEDTDAGATEADEHTMPLQEPAMLTSEMGRCSLESLTLESLTLENQNLEGGAMEASSSPGNTGYADATFMTMSKITTTTTDNSETTSHPDDTTTMNTTMDNSETHPDETTATPDTLTKTVGDAIRPNIEETAANNA